jgi:6-pyruvoyltetrahydropterin/6-carboxytetrahydropterin synthase
MIFVTRKEHFNAAHKLFNPAWSDEKNQEVFGKCSNPNWHGHNYDLYVTIKGDPDPDTGFVFDLKKMSNIIKAHVIEKMDHKNVNMDVAFMKGKFASTEMIAITIWEQLAPYLNTVNCRLHCIKLMETERNYVEYFGPGN